MTNLHRPGLRDDPLARLRVLELHYDGPIPADALADLHPTPAAVRRMIADGAFLDRLARDAARAGATAELTAIRAAGLALRAGG